MTLWYSGMSRYDRNENGHGFPRGGGFLANSARTSKRSQLGEWPRKKKPDTARAAGWRRMVAEVMCGFTNCICGRCRQSQYRHPCKAEQSGSKHPGAHHMSVPSSSPSNWPVQSSSPVVAFIRDGRQQSNVLSTPLIRHATRRSARPNDDPPLFGTCT